MRLAAIGAIGAILFLIVFLNGGDKSGTDHLKNNALPNSSRNNRDGNFEISRNGVQHNTIFNPQQDIRSKIKSDLSNLDEMIALARSIEDGERRAQTLKMIVDLWARKDPDASFRWANSLDEKVGKDYIIAQTILTLVNTRNPQKAESLLSLLPAGNTKDVSIEYCISEAASFDVSLAVRLASLLASPDTMKMIAGGLAGDMVKNKDFMSLQQMTDEVPHGMMKEYLNSAAIKNLSSIDPFLALDWMKKNPNNNTSLDLLDLSRGFSEKNILEGIEIAKEFNDKNGKNEFLGFMVGNWATKDQAAAINWAVNQIQNSSYANNKIAFDSIAHISIIKDQDFIFEQIAQIENVSERSAATLSAAKILSEYNPEKAAQIALATPGNQAATQIDTLTVTTRNWLIRDPLAASKWIGSLSNGPVRDSAVSELVTNILSKDKDIVMANSWAAQILDPKIRAIVNANIDRTKP